MSDLPPTLVQALADRYRIERKLGEGGMAVVYLADDLKHDRRVALKVLRPELAAVVGAERFLAEIKTTAHLQHPHILPLFDSGEADGFLYYVMPYVEGETLRDRLDRHRQLPVDEAVDIARKVSAALHHAHERGVIHRDIKPANILVQDGEPVVADFGIALAMSAAGGTRLTETGLSLGTPYYMSPEQATGDQQLGPQSDTYALACVLYEMLVGEPPFVGPTAQAVLSRIIAGGLTSAAELRPAIPAHVDAALRKALEKLPADRFPSAHAFGAALGDPGFRYGDAVEVVAARDAGGWKLTALVFAGATVILAGALGWALTRTADSAGVLRYTMDPGTMLCCEADAFGSQVAISPDGRSLVMTREAESTVELVVRERGRLEPRPVPGGDNAHQPFFSPDGSQLGFVTINRELKTASLTGEPPLTLLDSGLVRFSGSWGTDGYIYFSQGTSQGFATGGLARVPATGGAVEVVTEPDAGRQEVDHGFADAIPGGRGVLFTVSTVRQYDPTTQFIAVADTETGEHRHLVPGVMARWSSTGHVLVVDADGTLSAAPFDASTLELTGPLTSLLAGIPVGSQGGADITVSETGTLVHGMVPQGTGSDRVVWVSRSGSITDVDASWSGWFTAPVLSPDGRRFALQVREDGEEQIWIADLDAGSHFKLTFQGTRNIHPSWTPDGDTVLFVSNRGGNFDAYAKSIDQSPARLVLDLETDIAEILVSPDGEWLVYETEGQQGDLFAMPREGDEAVPIATSGGDELGATISPDGRWIAYVSTGEGLTQVFVRPFPNTESGFWQVSRDWGQDPVWSGDGTELFFRGRNEMMAVRTGSGPVFTYGEPRVLFPLSQLRVAGSRRPDLSVSPDGERFLMIRREGEEGHIVIVENFFEELRARVGG